MSTSGRFSPSSATFVPRFVESPYPSVSPPQPQHFTVPASIKAHMWYQPPATCCTVRPAPSLATGEFPSKPTPPTSALVPIAHWPYAFHPQHFALPSSRTTHIVYSQGPVVRLAAVRPVPKSMGGKKSPISSGWSPRTTESPWASTVWVCPPQHLTFPSSRRAHVLMRPGWMSVAP